MKKLQIFTVYMIILALTGCGRMSHEGKVPESVTAVESSMSITQSNEELNSESDSELPIEEEMTEDGVVPDSTTAVPSSKYRDAKVAVSLSERLDSRVGVMYREMVRHMVVELGFRQGNINMLDCGLDAELQKEQLPLLLEKKPDVVLIAPADVNIVPEMTDICVRAHVPVIYIMSEPEESEKIRWEKKGLRACYVGPNGGQSGTDQGVIAAACRNHGDVNGDGTVRYVMLQGDPNDPTGRERTEYSVRGLRESGVRTELLLLQRADWKRDKAKMVISDALDRYGSEIEVIFCGNDEMALGAADAVSEYGLKEGKDLYIIGAVGSVDAIQAVIDGKITGTVFDDYKAQAKWAGNYAASMIDGDESKQTFYLNPTGVTIANANEMLEYCRQ